MFAVVVAGRLPLTLSNGGASQVDATHLAFPLERAGEINHVTVFMTGETAFPPGYAATVHFMADNGGASSSSGSSSGSNGGSASAASSSATAGSSPPAWKLLGCLRNDKASAVFRVKGLAGNGSSNNNDPAAAAAAATATATLGISVEPNESVEAQMAALESAKAGASSGGSGSAGAGQLVRAGQIQQTPIDPNVALALAPKIGKSGWAAS